MIFLAVLAFFMLTVHAMFVYHGNNVVTAAAQDTLLVAQRSYTDVESPSSGTIKQVGYDRLDLFPGLTNRLVELERSDDGLTVSVTVKAKITTPFLVDAFADLEVTVVGPIERFVDENERG